MYWICKFSKILEQVITISRNITNFYIKFYRHINVFSYIFNEFLRRIVFTITFNVSSYHYLKKKWSKKCLLFYSQKLEK